MTLQWNRAFAFEQVGEDEDLLSELLDLLRDSANSDFEKIKAGSEAGDAKAIGDAAHSIKGASSNLGIEGLRLIAYELEKAGRDGDIEKAKTLIPKIEILLAELESLK